MPARRLHLEPTSVPEWDAEDLLADRLSSEAQTLDASAARALLADVRFELPAALDDRELTEYSMARQTPLDAELQADAKRYAFHLVELPLTILIPEGQRLARLRLTVGIEADRGGRAVAYDLFPKDRWQEVAHDVGEVSLDVAKALTFAFPAPAGDVLGLNLKLPLRWTTRKVAIRTSDRMSNPVEWYVRDRGIDHGFTAYLIVRAARGATVTLETTLVGELRRSGALGRFTKAAFRAPAEQYILGRG